MQQRTLRNVSRIVQTAQMRIRFFEFFMNYNPFEMNSEELLSGS